MSPAPAGARAAGGSRVRRGRAWTFPGVLDVDWEICPYSLVRDLQHQGVLTYEQLGRYCMINVDPEFPKKVRPGDFLVAQENMGYGHDHDHACMSIRGVGVAAVLCESAAPYFLRNSIDHGLPVLEITGIWAEVAEGDVLEVDLAEGAVRNITRGTALRFVPFPPFILERLEAGGIYPLLKARLGGARPGSAGAARGHDTR